MAGGARSRSVAPLRALAWAGAIACLLFTFLVLPFMLVRNRDVRDWLLEGSLHRGLLPAQWHLRIDHVDRFDPTGIELRGIRLASDDAAAEWLALRSFTVRWKAGNLIRRRLWADLMVLDSLVIDLGSSPPSFGGSRTAARGESGGSGGLPWLRLDSLAVNDISVRRGEDLFLVGSLALAQLEHDKGRVRSRLRSIRAAHEPESVAVSIEDGSIEGMLPGEFSIRGALLGSRGLSSSLEADISFPREPGDRMRGTATFGIDHLRPMEIAPLSKIGFPWAEEDTLSGMIRADLGPHALTARVDLAGLLLGAPLGRFGLLAILSGETLAVEDLSLRHRAGRLAGEGRFLARKGEGRGRLDIADLSLGDPALAVLSPGLPRARAGGRLEGAFVAAADGPQASARLLDAWFEGLGSRIEPIALEGELASRVVRLDSLRVGQPGHGVSGHGAWEIDGGALRGRFRLEGAGLEDLAQPFLEPAIGGEVSGTVILGGTVASPRLLASLDATDFRILEARAGRVAADSVVVALSPLRVRGKALVEQADIFGVPADSAGFLVDWDRTLKVDAWALLDTLSLAASADIIPTDPGSLTIDPLVLTPGSLPSWRASRPVRLTWARGGVRIEEAELASAHGRARGGLEIGPEGIPLRGALTIEDFDLDLVRRGLELPESMVAGRIDLEAKVAGSMERPECDATLRGTEIVAARWPIGPLRSRLALEAGGELCIDSLDAGVGGGRGRLRARNLSVLAPVPFPQFVESIRDSMSAVLRGTGISGSLCVEDLSVRRLVRTGLESVPGGGRTLLLESVDPMTARIRTVGVGDSAEAVAVEDAIDGEIGLALTLGGAIVAPRAKLKGRIDRLHLYQAEADSLLFGFSYVPQDLTLDSLVWCRDDQRARARGAMPLILSPAIGRASVPKDRPLSLDASLPVIDLAILGLLSRQIHDPKGTLSGAISLRGTPRRAWAEGNLSIRGGEIRLPKREERLREINGDVVLDSTGLRIRSLRGRIGEDGRIDVVGYWRDPADFKFDAKVDDATLYETGLYHLRANGDLSVFPVEEAGGSYPLIVGTVEVEEGAIIGDLAKQQPPPPTPGARPSPVRAEIDVKAPGDLRISTAIASVQLGEGEDLHVSFADPLVNVSGRIRVLGGRYRVFNNVFTVTDGTVEFRDTGRGPEPILDVNAQTRVPERGGLGEAPQEITVLINATGPVAALNLEFSSQPERTQDEVIELLSIGRLTDASTGTVGVTDPSRQYLFTELVSQIESQITQLIAPLEKVQLEPGESAGEAWRLSVRQTLLPQVSLAYSRELAGAADQGVSLHYNLRGQLYLNAGVERRIETGTPTDRYSLDLKLRFEYK